MYMCVTGIDFVPVSTIYRLGFMNCSDGVVFFVFRFMAIFSGQSKKKYESITKTPVHSGQSKKNI